MYYKITNKDSKVYQELHEMRSNEIQWAKDNIAAIEEKAGFKFKSSLSHAGQQNFSRLPEYFGFKFIDAEDINPKIWKEHKDHNGIYVPYTRTKLGREMAEFILNGLKKSCYSKPIGILKAGEAFGRFTFPFVEICGDTIIIYLGSEHTPTVNDVIEITKTEFEKLNAISE